jgi:hypothetical protein
MPLPLSVLIWYWSMTQSWALRLRKEILRSLRLPRDDM